MEYTKLFKMWKRMINISNMRNLPSDSFCAPNGLILLAYDPFFKENVFIRCTDFGYDLDLHQTKNTIK